MAETFDFSTYQIVDTIEFLLIFRILNFPSAHTHMKKGSSKYPTVELSHQVDIPIHDDEFSMKSVCVIQTVYINPVP